MITMTMTELDRLKVVQAVCERRLKPGQAADPLALSVRQVERLVLRYRSQGASGLLSRHRGHPSNYQLADGVAERALNLIRDCYADFGPTLACEKLRECHGLGLSKETVRHLMTEAGLWIPRRQRPPKIYQPRARRACLGELIQIDGSDHRWFEERSPACTLLVYIDDATSRLMALHFTATESTFSYFEATRGYLEQHGSKPRQRDNKDTNRDTSTLLPLRRFRMASTSTRKISNSTHYFRILPNSRTHRRSRSRFKFLQRYLTNSTGEST
ncbi:hypothetical protein OKW42_003193 [Paraburkholderia sp. WC7.3d]